MGIGCKEGQTVKKKAVQKSGFTSRDVQKNLRIEPRVAVPMRQTRGNRALVEKQGLKLTKRIWHQTNGSLIPGRNRKLERHAERIEANKTYAILNACAEGNWIRISSSRETGWLQKVKVWEQTKSQLPPYGVSLFSSEDKLLGNLSPWETSVIWIRHILPF